MVTSRILIVEDERTLSKHLERILREWDYDVVGTVSSGEDAVVAARETRPDLVLMDVQLNGAMTGIDAAKLISKEIDAAVVYITGYANWDQFEQAMPTEPFGYLAKPVSNGELRRTVEVALHRRRLERRLRASEDRFRTLVDTAPHGIAVITSDRNFEYANPKFAEIFGYTSEDLRDLDTWLGKAYSPDDMETLTRGLREAKSVPDAAHRETSISIHSARCKDGSQKTVRHRTVILEDGSHVTSCEDISDAKMAEKRLIQAERLKAVAELASGVAHNFNNVLQIVLGSTEMALISLDMGKVSRAKEYLLEVAESIRFGAETVRRLQEFSRSRPDGETRKGEIFDLSRTVEHALEVSKPWWKSGPEKAGIEVTLESELVLGCYVKGNKHEIFEVVVNLLKNAVDALPDGGDIKVFTFMKNGLVVLRVLDNGIGIPTDNLDKIFEPFFSTKGDLGTGMGLASSFGIIHDHGGRISFESNEVTTFTVELPLADFALEDLQGETERPGVNLRILVIDDRYQITELLRRGLDALGHTVFTALNGQDGLEKLREHPIDLVVCDLGMPGPNGWEVAQSIRKYCRAQGTPKPPFIMLSGWADEARELERIGECGVDAFVSKPVEIPELQKVINHLFREGNCTKGQKADIDSPGSYDLCSEPGQAVN